jgi:hypothetical protein
MTLPSGTFIFLSIAAALFALGYWRFQVRSRKVQSDLDWFLAFSSDRYAILGRMLAGEDYDWILTEVGDRRMCEELRGHRRAAFRKYLSELSDDFRKLQRVAKMIAVDSTLDEAKLVRFLFIQSVQFYCQLAAVRWRLVLSASRSGNIDVRGLLALVERTHSHVFWIAAEIDHSSGARAI